MNVQLSKVISYIIGEAGLLIIEAIFAGQRDPMQIAALCNTRISEPDSQQERARSKVPWT
jgi:hypothetical protein